MEFKQHNAVLILVFLLFCPVLGFGQRVGTRTTQVISLGQASTAPAKNLPVPLRQARAQDVTVTGPFTVNTAAREEVREFYNAIYYTSENVPINSTADVANCIPGTNSTDFILAVLRRINWVRAMAGIPAGVTLDATYNADDQEMALMIAANNALNHNPPSTYSCYTDAGAGVAGSNQAIGANGADAITDYIWDFGASNSEVGHRRWILFPQTLVMGTGDIPAMEGDNAANATWVFDSSINDPRPATEQPYVSWPPTGYVPYQMVFPYWSFALSNADLSLATVSMTSNGVSVATVIQPYQTGYGENTLVWVPMGLDATAGSTMFPFDGADTVYGVTVSNINVSGSPVSFSYAVTVFDPAVPGSDYIPTAISGTSEPSVNGLNVYTAAPPNNTNVTSYNWIVGQVAPGNSFEDANADETGNGLVNYSISPPPNYPIITNSPDGSPNYCIHLCHDDTNSYPQLLQLNAVLLPTTNTVLSFASELGYATSNEVARVQVSLDNGITWQDIYTEAGTNGPTSSFTNCSLSLANYAGEATLLRFDYDFQGGSYYDDPDNFVGWCLENILITNSSEIIGEVTNATSSANFVFTPAQAGAYALQAQPVIFNEFPLDAGPISQVVAIGPGGPGIVLGQPVLANGQITVNFTAPPGMGTTFQLLQSSQLGGPWFPAVVAILTTNVPGSYSFTTASPGATQFYIVQSL